MEYYKSGYRAAKVKTAILVDETAFLEFPEANWIGCKTNHLHQSKIAIMKFAHVTDSDFAHPKGRTICANYSYYSSSIYICLYFQNISLLRTTHYNTLNFYIMHQRCPPYKTILYTFENKPNIVIHVKVLANPWSLKQSK